MRELLDRLFFNAKRYNLGDVGRYRINRRLDVGIPFESTVLHLEDFMAIIRYLLGLRIGQGNTDDIDHLGNRRVRLVGELLANQFSIGLTRMARTIRERMNLRDEDQVTPHDLVNARTVSTVVQAFFRFEPALAVYPADQSARRVDPQAPPQRPRPGGAEPRPRRF